jgi:hypothetical protein
MCIHSSHLSWLGQVRLVLVTLGDKLTLPRQLGGDWKLGDLSVELMRDPTHVVSGSG